MRVVVEMFSVNLKRRLECLTKEWRFEYAVDVGTHDCMRKALRRPLLCSERAT